MSTQDTPQETDTSRVRPLADVLAELNGGRAHATASEQLHQLVTAVRETGKGGSLTVQITVKPAAKGDGSTVLVTAVSKTKRPEAEAQASVFFVTADDNLTRDNPQQPQLPLRSAPEPPTLRSANQ